MVFEIRQYERPQPMPQKSKRKQNAVSLPQNHMRTSNAAENLNNIWASQCTQETLDEITDKAPGLHDELPPMEELWKVKPPNDNTGAKPGVPSTFTSLDDITSSTSYVQADSDTEISSKTHDCTIVIDEDTNLDQNIDSGRSPQSLDMTFLAPNSPVRYNNHTTLLQAENFPGAMCTYDPLQEHTAVSQTDNSENPVDEPKLESKTKEVHKMHRRLRHPKRRAANDKNRMEGDGSYGTPAYRRWEKELKLLERRAGSVMGPSKATWDSQLKSD